MDETKISAQVGNETHKWACVAAGPSQDIVVFAQRCGRDDAAVMQSGDTCIDDIHSMRLDSKVETGQSALYKNLIATACETLRFVSRITERIILPGCTWGVWGDEALSLGPMDMIALGRFELRTVTPLVARIKTPPNPSGQASNPYKWRQLQQ